MRHISRAERIRLATEWSNRTGFEFMGLESVDGTVQQFADACRHNLKWLENVHTECGKMFSRALKDRT